MPPVEHDPRLRPDGSAPRRARSRAGTAAVLVALLAAGTGGVLGARWVLQELRSQSCEFRAADRTESFTPEQSANAATITMVAVQRDLPPRAASIALATAIQESELRNIDYGDADSVGLFQQRPSQGWGSQEEILDPVYASHAFYDALLEVPGWEDMEITVAAQEVQRSAYPGAYADHEWEGRVLASTLTGQTPAGMGCDLDAADGSGSATDVLAKAERQFGGSGQAAGDTVTLTAASDQDAWAVASWAVAHAQSESVVLVQVDGMRWDRSLESPTWQDDEDGSTSGATVLITVAG